MPRCFSKESLKELVNPGALGQLIRTKRNCFWELDIRAMLGHRSLESCLAIDFFSTRGAGSCIAVR